MSLPEPVPGAGAITQLALKVFGPTADYMGGRLLDSVKASENMVRVLVKTIAKLGSRADEEGSVPPRVVKEFLNQAPFCDEELCAEYLSGLLASSRTAAGKDEESLSLITAVSRLPNTALLLHFSAYRALMDAEPKKSDSLYAIKVSDTIDKEKTVEWAMEAVPETHHLDKPAAVELLSSREGLDRVIALWTTRIRAATDNLKRERLIDDISSIGHPSDYKKSFGDESLGEMRFVYSPTNLGWLLFIRLHGYKGSVNEFQIPSEDSYDPSLPHPTIERLDQLEADRFVQSLL